MTPTTDPLAPADPAAGGDLLPTRADLEALFRTKYGDPGRTGWAPALRHRFGYYQAADVYEAAVARCIGRGARWADVGGGHHIFPDNPKLAAMLVERSGDVTAIDPSENVLRNPFVHRRIQAPIEEYRGDGEFDVATLRMVAEHIAQPERAVAALHRMLAPGGLAVVFTVNKRAPVALLSRATPFWLHYPIKRVFWGGEEEDTFPVVYQMNTRGRLKQLFAAHGFGERAFAYVDDCSAFGQIRGLSWCELQAWRACRATLGFYPENCLLGIYQKT